ncbi:hypothetical protein L9F63_014501, partial [Diploptera punctata]
TIWEPLTQTLLSLPASELAPELAHPSQKGTEFSLQIILVHQSSNSGSIFSKKFHLYLFASCSVSELSSLLFVHFAYILSPFYKFKFKHSVANKKNNIWVFFTLARLCVFNLITLHSIKSEVITLRYHNMNMVLISVRGCLLSGTKPAISRLIAPSNASTIIF